MIILQAKNISLGYSEAGLYKKVIEHFNLLINAGELVTLLGPSGVGKSSLLRVLGGLQQPEQGEVILFKEKISKPHHQVGFIFQTPALLPWLNVKENVMFGLSGNKQDALDKGARIKRATDALAEVGLEKEANLYPNSLSGGMAQKVALARTIARKSKIILLDEPFSALDEVSREEMQVLLRNLVLKHNTTAVLVTHDIDEALLVSNKIVLLGKQPAIIIAEWILADKDTGRSLLKMQDKRLDILKALHLAKEYQQQAATIEYII